jgi:hypothetical protein
MLLFPQTLRKYLLIPMKHLLFTLILLITFPIATFAQWQMYGGLSLDRGEASLVTTSPSRWGIEMGSQRELAQVGVNKEITLITDVQLGFWSDRFTENNNVSCDDCIVFEETKLSVQGLVGVENAIWDQLSLQLMVGPAWNRVRYNYESGGTGVVDVVGSLMKVVTGNTQISGIYKLPAEHLNLYASYRLAFPLLSENDIPYWQQFAMGVRYRL